MQIKLLPARFARPIPLLAAALFFVLLITVTRLHNGSLLPAGVIPGSHKAADKSASTKSQKPPQRPPPNRAPVSPGQCAAELDFLRRVDLALSDTIKYTRRCVKRMPSKDFDRSAVANISKPLFARVTDVNLTDCNVQVPIPCDDLPLHVPFPYPAKDYKHLVFGIASKYNRIEESLPAFAHWLSDTGSLLLGIVVDEGQEKDGKTLHFDLAALEQEYAAAGVNATFIAPTLKKHPKTGERDDRTEHHHFMLIRDLLERSDADTRWIGVLDDDTFFPSIYNLDLELQNHHHTKSLWLGALSDNFNSLRNWGFMAYGGAGAFLSIPLARELEPYLEQCIVETTVDTGDGILRDCVYTHSHTKLTIVPHMYQHDMHGDMSGFYESGIKPLSVHHWKSWYHEPIPQEAAISSLCGDCFLARWRFADDTLLANGYSVTKYTPGVLDSVDLDRMESTWDFPGHEYDFSFSPRRDKLDKSQKKSYHLVDVDVSEKLGFRQIYVYKGDWEKGEQDEVIELMWETE
ncbi:glycosyltransferase family 31 protein [Coniochaeta sp. 2T2.1]|nr:glycosyltransferase family 31 protein [Coniochaeta sp. 2T2.1]